MNYSETSEFRQDRCLYVLYSRQMNDYRWLKSMGTKLWANPLNHKATDFGLTNPPSALETLRTSGVAMGPGAS
jgi:hypothetical protein